MLYRFGFRILPYGDPGDDWLELDENAFGSRGFKLNRQQIMGRVLLQTPHAVLGEQTNREGLVRSEASDALRKILMWAFDNERSEERRVGKECVSKCSTRGSP